MRIAFFGAKRYEREAFDSAHAETGSPHELHYLEPRLEAATVPLAAGFPAVCVFVNDHLDAPILDALARAGVSFVALRCAGFNNVDLAAAHRLDMKVVRVPAYSPHAVAEHAVALMLGLNRKTHRAYNRVREGNFSLEGLTGFDFHGKTAGVIGTGKIGVTAARILLGFGCRVLAHDVAANPACSALGVSYVSLAELYRESDIITLHAPLTPQTRHMIDESALEAMKPGVMLVNTSRGALVDTRAVIKALKSGRIGSLGLDVYEEEEGVFFEDVSERGIRDDVLARLMTFPNVLITGHQAFLTREALHNIARTTLDNLSCLERGEACPNRVEVS